VNHSPNVTPTIESSELLSNTRTELIGKVGAAEIGAREQARDRGNVCMTN